MASSSGRIYGWLESQRFDVIGAIGGLLLAVMMLPLRLIASNLYILGIPVMIGLASVLYLLAVRTDHSEGLPAMPIWLGRLLPSLVLLGTALLIVLGLWQGGRTPAFYNLATLVGIAIFAQVFFTRERDFVPGLLIVQIMAFALTIRFISLFTTPGFTGIDVWTHVPNWSAAILESGSLAPLADNKYYAAPLFHLLTVSTSLLSSVSVRSGLILSVGTAMAFSPLFVYVAARLFVSERWSLFALAVFAITAHTIEWSIHLIPTSLGLVFFLGVFYLLVRALNVEPGGREFLMIVVFSIGTILTHQISAFIMLVVTGAGLFAHLLLRFDLFSPPSRVRGIRTTQGDSVSLTGLLAFDLGFITFMWSLTPYHGDTFLATTFSFFRSTLAESEGFGDLSGEGAAAAAGADPTLIEQAVNYIDAAVFLSLFMLTVVGCLYVLRRRNISHATFMCGVSVVVMLVFIFGFPMFGIRTFIPQRWYAFLAAPMALLSAIGVAYLARRLNPPTIVAILLVFTLVFPAVSMAATNSTIDDPRFEGAQTKYSYEQSELNAVDTIGDIHPLEEGERYHTDHPYNTVFSRAGPGPAAAANISDEGRQNTDVLIHREQQRLGATFFVEDEEEGGISPAMSRSELCGAERHYSYDNGEVAACPATWEIDASDDTGGDLGGGEDTGGGAGDGGADAGGGSP
ncbi:hypothetical protein [Halalkalicoccus salilacus]|uniref:hypothetical protein n=1 Tax=Halalkalicoccus salilacus TaxID=3117459 RepID=UPI00300E7388